MSIGFVFWLIYLVWVVFGFFGYDAPPGRWGYGRHIVIAILLGLLGWHEFGFPIHG